MVKLFPSPPFPSIPPSSKKHNGPTMSSSTNASSSTNIFPSSNTSSTANASPSANKSPSPSTPTTPDLDIACIGFGPAGLSLAIALAEQPQRPKVTFFERNSAFTWRAHDFLPGKCKVRNNLLQDLVTSRNPLSMYTFVNYLWSTDNLVAYTNLGATNPPRALFARYLAWCAEMVGKSGWVRYGEETTSIEPVKVGDVVDHWRLAIRSVESGEVKSVTARKVVLAVGVQPKAVQFAKSFGLQQNVYHASQFGRVVPTLDGRKMQGLKVAVVGCNDEAVEIYDYCAALPDVGGVTLFPGEGRLRPSEENPFIPTIADTDDNRPFELRRTTPTPSTHSEPSTGVHRQAFDSLYEQHYSQLVKERDQRKHKFRICPDVQITCVRKDEASGRITMHLDNGSTSNPEPAATFDYLFDAAGYERSLLQRLMKPVSNLFDSVDGSMSAEHTCKINFRRGTVSPNSGVWVLDGFADGVEDSFPFLALRTEKVMRSLLSTDVKDGKERSRGGEGEKASRAVL